MDTEKSGKISEKCFRKVMLGNEGVHPRDVEEMLEEYYRQPTIYQKLIFSFK